MFIQLSSKNLFLLFFTQVWKQNIKLRENNLHLHENLRPNYDI